MKVLGVDIGGSGIKGALVDTRRGTLVTERVRYKTPKSMTPDAVLDTVVQVADTFSGFEGPIGMGFPAVVQDGSPRTPFTAKQVPGWVGYPVAASLAERTGRPVTMINDADAAGMAEMRFGNGWGQTGVVIVLTLGTGIGSAMFTNGNLVPNCEFSALYLRNHEQFAEKYAADSARKRDGLTWSEYAARLDEYLHHLQRVFSPQLVIIGGGVSDKHNRFLPALTVDFKVLPAALRNQAGIIGAALAMSENWHN